MSKLRFYTGSSNYIEVAPPVSASTFQLTLPTSSGTIATQGYADTTATTAASSSGLVKITDSTLTSASAVSINNCFTSTYDNYRIVFRGASSTFASIRLRMRASGTDATGTNYRNMDFYVSGNTTVTGGYSLDAQGAITATTTTDSLIIFDVTAPFLAQYTNISGQHVRDNTLAVFGVDHQLATSYDGFTIYPTTGTITGTLRVYGYRN